MFGFSRKEREKKLTDAHNELDRMFKDVEGFQKVYSDRWVDGKPVQFGKLAQAGFKDLAQEFERDHAQLNDRYCFYFHNTTQAFHSGHDAKFIKDGADTVRDCMSQMRRIESYALSVLNKL